MQPENYRRLAVLSLVVALLFALPAAAGKRRAVRHPSAGPQLTAVITGTVLDAVTGAPISKARVTAGDDFANTSDSGKFKLDDVVSYGSILLRVERSGYTEKTFTFTSGGTIDQTIRLDPTPTVRVLKSDGATLDLDNESIEFGYAVPFSGYRKADFEDFCFADGTKQVLDRTQIKKITGPATLATQSSCCAERQVQKVTLELRTGATVDAYFVDSCEGYTVDLLGREHVSGDFKYTKFSDIREVVFP